MTETNSNTTILVLLGAQVRQYVQMANIITCCGDNDNGDVGEATASGVNVCVEEREPHRRGHGHHVLADDATRLRRIAHVWEIVMTATKMAEQCR